MSTAIDDVITERRRQIEVEDWTTEHDDRQTKGEMARAAACYCAIAGNDAETRDARLRIGWMPATWPWDWAWWKPKDRRRDLVRAGALIIAEIERLDRAKETT
jgi:hypothetical protein